MNTIQNCFRLLVFSILVFIPTQLLAQTYTVYTVADTGTQMPTQSIAFGNMNVPVAIPSPESESFFGTSGINEGIYNNFGGTVNVIANQSTPVPGGSGNFTGFLTRPINLETAPDVAFPARSFGRVGMYTWINGVFNVVLDSSMNLPGVMGTNATFILRAAHLGGTDIGFVVLGSSGEQAIFVHVGGVLELVADTGTPIPGGTGNFTSMTFINVLDDNTLIFLGQGSGGQRGYYAYTGSSIVTLVDTNTPIPDGIGNFTNFSQQPEGIGGANFVFSAFGSGGQRGIYTIIGGVLDVVVDTNDFYPGTTDNYTGFGSQPQHLGGGDFIVEAIAFGSSRNGVIRVVSGVVSLAIDNSDPIPGGTGNFTFFRRLTPLGGLDFAFEGEGGAGQRGIYTFIADTAELVVDRNTQVPGGSGGDFNSFSFLISLGDGDVGFRGGELGTGASDGIYDFIDGTLSLVANNFVTPVPDSFGIFISLSDIDRIPETKEVAFFATSPALEGLYTHINLTLGFVADIETPIPGGNVPGATFRRFTDPVSIGNDDVVFFADGTDFELGFYSFISGALAVVADLNTPIPVGTGNFTSFPICAAGGGGGGGGIVGGIDIKAENDITARGEEPPLEPGNIVSPSDGNMAFLGQGSGGQIGIYSSIAGVLGVIADTTTPIPGGTGNFTNYTCVVSLGNGEVAFVGEGSGGQNGIYATVGGVPTLIADLNTPVPDGTGNYTSFGLPVSIDDGNIAFIGSDSGFQQGIYRSIGGVLSTVADFSTPVPGGGGNFNFFLNPVSIAGGDITFRGFSSNNGIYTFIGGVLAVLVDNNTTIPGGTGNFTNFGIPAANPSGDIAFRAFGSGGQSGLYAVVSGNLVLIVDANSPIPGGVGNYQGFTDPVVALTGRDWAYRATGGFDQIGIYNAILGTGSLTIVKETNPPGGTGFGFEGTGAGMQGCELDGTFTLDDQEFITCDLTPGSYTVQETDFPGYTLTDIDCVGASSFSETPDSVTVNLELGEIVVCTFTNTQIFVLNPIFPALDDNINSISAEQALPGGRVAFIWGKATGSTTIGGRVCNGLELGIKNPKILAIAPTNDLGVATHIFYIPTFGDLAFEIQLQAIDINTCRESNVVPQIIRKDESG